MGRVKVQLKKIENKTYRHITFAKRKSGLVKKAFEISTLCDVEVALIIFSPAGKLILFEGKERVEEILMHYIDLPHHQRGRLHDQELVNWIVAQMSQEAELRHQLASSGARDSKMSIDSQLEEIKNEICICNLKLEEVEKQLQYFLEIPSCIKSKVEADYYEEIVQKTLKLVVIHKQIFEAKSCIQPAYHSEKQLYPQATIPEGFIMGISNYILEWPQQHDTRILTSKFANATGLQSFRSQTQPLAEMLQSSYPANNPVSRASAFDGYIYQSEYDKFFNADIPFGMINVCQGTATKTGQTKLIDATVACPSSCSSNLHCGCAIPFPL